MDEEVKLLPRTKLPDFLVDLVDIHDAQKTEFKTR